MTGLAGVGLGVSLGVAATGAVYIEGLNDLHTNSVGTLAAWVAALVLVEAALVALTHKGRHAGWFHPLSLPFATPAVMSLGAALWVSFTHEVLGLLHDTGYQPAISSMLAVAVSVTACEALTLVVVGYMVRVGAAFALTEQAKPAVVEQLRGPNEAYPKLSSKKYSPTAAR